MDNTDDTIQSADDTYSAEPVLLQLRAEVRRDTAGKLVHLAVHGFPVGWSNARVHEDCRRAVILGTANEVDRLIIEAGGCPYATSTGGPAWRLYVDET